MSSIIGTTIFSADDLGKIKKGEFVTIDVKLRKVVSRWKREVGKEDEDFKDAKVNYYVGGICHNLSDDAIIVIGYYYEPDESQWYHVNMIIAKDPKDKNTAVSIRPSFAPHKSIVYEYHRRMA